MRVAVVGAGLSGLMAARALHAEGHEVVVLDKGRSPGGRLATRRIGGATVDHGAQFFTVRSDVFAAMVQVWERDGLVREWCRGFGARPDGYPRYAVAGGMNTLAKYLATGLDVRCGTLVFAIRPQPGGWNVGLDDGTAVAADGVVVTCPLPQAGSLLITSGATMPEALRRTDYDRTLALLALLDRPSAVPAPGGVQSPSAEVDFVADNQAKGISVLPAVTLHASPDWSAARWDAPPASILAELQSLLRPWLGRAAVVEAQVKRWRFATPQAQWRHPCHVLEDADAPVVLAGDAFAGPRVAGPSVEGAALSGLAAAAALTS
jgi:hypothetical protein